MFIITKKKRLTKKRDTSNENEIRAKKRTKKDKGNLDPSKEKVKDDRKPRRSKKKRKKVYRYGRLKCNLIVGIVNIVAWITSLIFLVAFFVPKLTLNSLLVTSFTLVFTGVLISNIISLYYSRNSKIPIVGSVLGIVASLVMIIYPTLGFFLAIIFYAASIYFHLKKQRYLVVPKKRQKPFYKQPLLLVAIVAALALGGAQAAFAMNRKEAVKETKTTESDSKTKKKTSKKKAAGSTSQSSSSKTEETSASKETKESSKTEETTESTEKPPEEKTYEPVNIGQEQTIESLIIKVTEIKEQMELRPQNTLESGPDELVGMPEEQVFQPVEGAKFLLVYLNIRNTSDEATFFSQNDVMLVGQGGEEYYGVPVFGVEGFMENVNLEPNTEAGGFVVFEIPGDIAAQSLQMRYIGMYAPENGTILFNLQ